MLNENIKSIRKSKGLSQEELAIKLNVVPDLGAVGGPAGRLGNSGPQVGEGSFPNLKIPPQNPRLHYFQTKQFWR